MFLRLFAFVVHMVDLSVTKQFWLYSRIGRNSIFVCKATHSEIDSVLSLDLTLESKFGVRFPNSVKHEMIPLIPTSIEV